MKGRPKKPRALKLVEGTLRKGRDNPEPAFPETDGASAPYWLNDGPATEEWQRLLPLLESTRVMSEADVSALANLCNLQGKVIETWLAGDTPSAAQLSRLNAMQGRFGLTPADRGNVRPLGDGRPGNAFGKLEKA